MTISKFSLPKGCVNFPSQHSILSILPSHSPHLILKHPPLRTFVHSKSVKEFQIYSSYTEHFLRLSFIISLVSFVLCLSLSFSVCLCLSLPLCLCLSLSLYLYLSLSLCLSLFLSRFIWAFVSLVFLK